MKLHRCLFCLGSNEDKFNNLGMARSYLSKQFPTLIWGEIMVTEPLFFSHSPSFLNQLGFFETDLSVEAIKDEFKFIETEAGKKAEDKFFEIVRLDVDLLLYDRIIIKPKDMEREYIKRGIEEIQKILQEKNVTVTFPLERVVELD